MMNQESKWIFKNRELQLSLLFYLFLAILCVNHLLVFLNINISWIDSDQAFMWAGTRDYSKGLFYEPRFYGQDYNSFLEPLFAAPLLWFKVPVYYALPLATHFLFLFPFLFTAFYLFKKGRKENAILTLSILLCLPLAYDILTSIPRGFVTGLFFTSFFIISIFNPHTIKFIILNTVLSLIGYFINPNSLIVTAPMLAYLFFHNYDCKKYYLAQIACLACIYPLHLIFNQFYINHPSYVIYGLSYSISLKYISENLSHLNEAFQHISFFTEGNCITLLIILIALFFVFWKHPKKLLHAYLAFIGVILISFLSGKVRDGSNWPFYSFSRMYLGIPMVIYLLTAQINLSTRWIMRPLIAMTVLFSAFKFYTFNERVNYFTNDESRWLGVHIVPLKTVLGSIKVYKEVCKKHKVNTLIISNGFWLNTLLDYGGSAVDEDFPQTQETNSERRYWVREGNKDSVFTSFVYISGRLDIYNFIPKTKFFEVVKLDDYGLLLFKNNSLKNESFISYIKKVEAQ